MAAKLSIDILSDFNNRGVRDAERSMGRLEGVGKRLGGVMKGAAVGGAIAAGAAVVAFGKKSVTAASELQDSVGAIESTFSGKALRSIQQFGKDSATNVGLSTRAFNELAAQSGSILQAMGLDSGQAATAVEKLTTRAADLGTTLGMSTTDVMSKFGAALRGEMDPIEQVGIKLSAADVKAKAMAMGLADATGNIDSAAQAQATMALIMEQSAGKAGQWAAQTGTMSEQTQMMGAKFEEVAAKVGEIFLPIVQGLFDWIINTALPAIQTFVDNFSGLGGAFETVTAQGGPLQGIIAALTDAFNTVWPVIQQIIGVVIDMGKAIGSALAPVVEAIANFMTGTFIPTLKDIWSTIGSQLVPAWDKLVSALRPVLNFIGQVAAKLMGPLSQAFRIAGGAIKLVITIIGRIISVVASLIGAVTRVASAVAGTFASAWRSASSAINSVIGIINNVIGAIQNAIGAVKDFFSSGVGKIAGAVGGLFKSGRSATGRAAPATMAQPRAAAGSITVAGVANPQTLAHDLSRIITGARIRTGYTGIRL